MVALTDRRNGNTAATATPRLVRSEPISDTARVERAVTSGLRGVFTECPSSRAEVLALINEGRRSCG